MTFTYNINTATGDQYPAELELQMRLAQYQALIMEPHANNPKTSFQDKLVAAAATSDREIQDGTVPAAGAGGIGSKHARYTSEQVDALERLFGRCPKPTQKQRQQLLLDYPSLRNVDPYQIKVWFQNRRCREKKIRESSRLQVLNGQLNAMNSTLMDENSQLRQQLTLLMHENNVLRHHLNMNINSAATYVNHNHNYDLSNSSSDTRSASLSPTSSLPSPP